MLIALLMRNSRGGDRICSKAERTSRKAEPGETPKKSGKIRQCPENLQHCGLAGWQAGGLDGRVSTGEAGMRVGNRLQCGELDLSP